MPKQWTVEWVPLETLFANPANPRRNDAAVPHVVASIRRFGWQQPIVAKHSGEVIAGHTRLKAAKQLGETVVPVVRFEGSELDAIAFGIADNRTHEFAEWDDAALAKLLEELRDEDSLEGVGYTNEDIDELIAEIDAANGGAAGVDDQGPEAPLAETVSRAGDLWLLGNHRFLCGDSTKSDEIARVLAGDKAALIATDPPYCVDYTGMDRPVHDGKPSGKDWSHVYREVDIADLGVFLDGVLAACLPHLKERAPLYVWHAHVQQPTVAAAFERHGLLLHQVVVWVKPVATFGHSYFRWRHEPCAFGWVKGSKPDHGMAQLESVWECDWEGKQRVVGNEHPTQKPTRLFADLGYEPHEGRQVNQACEVVYVDRFHRMDWSVQAARIQGATRRYNNARVLVDVTDVGDPIFEALRKAGVAVEAYPFTAKSKSALVENLTLMLEERRLVLPQPNLWPEGIEELEACEYSTTDSGHVRTSSHSGMHDDCVIGLALAAWAVRHPPVKFSMRRVGGWPTGPRFVGRRRR